MRLRGRLGWLSAGIAVLSSVALAADEYKIDAGHSSVLFRVKHVEVSYFYGLFKDVSGSFVLDADHPAESRFDVTIKTESVDTRDAKRDEHRRKPEFFDVEKHPEMTFKSKSVEKASENVLKVVGDLTFRGVTKEITVRIHLTGAAKTQMGERAGIETTFSIKRSEYGMDFLLNSLGDEVRITVSLEGVKG